MAIQGSFVASILLACLVATCHGGVLFTSIKETLVVNVSHEDKVLQAGKDSITVIWSLNTTFPVPETDSLYKTIKVKLCYAPISQKDRGWRKTVADLKKDKTCLRKIVAKPYTAANNTFTWIIERDVPTAKYFVRAYAFNAADEELAYGQNTDSKKTTKLFDVQAITGRHVSLDIASICFSAFSIVSLFGFFYMEKKKAKAVQAK